MAPTVNATRCTLTPPICAPGGNDGATSASVIKPRIATASNMRSTTIDASAVLTRTDASRPATHARANSPARAGSRLFAMNPTATARQSGLKGRRAPAGSRSMTCHRKARSGNVIVATMTVAVNRRMSARRT